MADFELEVDPVMLKQIADQSAVLDEMVRAKCQEGIELAKAAFMVSERHDNEERTSETTPPKYMDSFFTRRISNGVHEYGNSDPAWVWVEYGAHAGGETEVLDYRPLGKSLDGLATE